MDPAGGEPKVDERHTQTLASALARAVDAKDSYTRSHCQTVSQLAALIATELGFSGDRLSACGWPASCTTWARSAFRT